MVERALQRRAREAQEWLLDACFPLWAERGVDGQFFCEALDMNHRQIEAASARVRVQARQTYVFAEAMRLGWDAEIASRLVALGYEALTGACRRSDGLFGHRVSIAEAALSDDTADLYDLAFALYALGQPGYAAENEALITQTLDAMEKHMRAPSGGYHETLPRPEFRLQDPHMHLLEACLQLCMATGQAHHLERATALRELALKHFIAPGSVVIGERFVQDSWATPPGDAGELISPGHQFEWVYLFDQYAVLTGSDLPEQAGQLYKFACSTLNEDGHAVQSCRRDGTLADTSRRTWPQTEALKAHLLMWRRGDQAAGERAMACFDVLMDAYLTPEGGWHDHLDATGANIAQNIPASTGYHVVFAFANLIETIGTE